MGGLGSKFGRQGSGRQRPRASKEMNPYMNGPLSGLAWINVDSTCRLHYQVRLNAGKKATEAKILLQDHPMQNLKVGTYLSTLLFYKTQL